MKNRKIYDRLGKSIEIGDTVVVSDVGGIYRGKVIKFCDATVKLKTVPLDRDVNGDYVESKRTTWNRYVRYTNVKHMMLKLPSIMNLNLE